MSEATMTLSDEQLEQVGNYVDSILHQRILWVEEELEIQRELVIEQLDDPLEKSRLRAQASDRRFKRKLEESDAAWRASQAKWEADQRRSARNQWILGIYLFAIIGVYFAVHMLV